MQTNLIKTRCFSILLVVMLFALITPLVPGVSAAPTPPPPTARRELTILQPESFIGPVSPPATAMGVTVAAWEKVVFQSFRDNNWEIYLMDGHAGNQRRLTYDHAADIMPRLNRGANRIVFASNRTGNYEIFVMNTDGSGLMQLTHTSQHDVNPVWSPDGTRIAFESYRDGQAEIYVMNADGSDQTRLTTHAGYDGQPTWSPDSKRLAFVSERSGNTRIWIMQANGSAVTQFPIDYYSAYPVWSPDGQKIAFSSDPSNTGWLSACQANLDGSDFYCPHVPQGQTDVWVGSWSPDSKDLIVTTISFIHYAGNWYWTEAYLETVPVYWTDPPYRLSTSGVDWNPDWATTDLSAPYAQISPLPEYTRAPDVVVNWSGADVGPAGIQGYDVQYRLNGGVWVPWLSNVDQTSATYSGSGGQRVDFRVRARDNASNFSAWTDEAVRASTQLYSRTLAGQIYDMRGMPVLDATIVITPASLNTPVIDIDGRFLAYLAHYGETQVQVAAPGRVGSRSIETYETADLLRVFWLGLENNLIQNGGFEADSAHLPGWQVAEDLSPTVTTYTQRSGVNAVNFSELRVCDVSTTSISLPNATFVVDRTKIIHQIIEEFSGSSVKLYYTYRNVDGTWSEHVYFGSAYNYGYSTSPLVAITPQGAIHVVWHTTNGFHHNYMLPDGSWQGDRLISADTSLSARARMISDNQGTIHRLIGYGVNSNSLKYSNFSPQVGWSAEYIVGIGDIGNITTGADNSVYMWSSNKYWQRLPSGSWLPPLTAPVAISNLVVDRSGIMHVRSGENYLYRTPAGEWSSPVVLPYSGGGNFGIDNQGTLYFFNSYWKYSSYTSYDIFLRSKPWWGDWSEPCLLRANMTQNPHPFLRIDELGHPYIVYRFPNYGSVHYLPLVCTLSVTRSATLSQSVTLPADMLNPTLAFFYDLHGATSENSEAFTVSVVDALTSTVIFSTTANTIWQHQWLDLSPWAGQTITVVFASKTLAGDNHVSLYLDDVALGAYYPDLWIEVSDLVSQPGQPIVQKLTYGNQSAAAAHDVNIVMPQSQAWLFESASVTPTFNVALAQYEWDLGTVLATSAHEIVITATVAPTVTWLNTYPYTVTISTPVAEANLLNNTASAQLIIARRLYLPLVLRNRWN